mmetsp:Transcript_113956/g.179384  ORF Transcript_113956/g.179384 Transcript_113956/m.179384 type:complete len:218 (-) Transcript_113956:6-659(-)
MGSSCCKDTASVQTDLNLPDGGQEKIEGEPQKVKRKVNIRRTIQEEEIGLNEADIEARQGADDPDLEKLYREAAERKAAKESGESKKRVSLTELSESIEASPDAETPVATKRSKGRKGTGFVKKQEMPKDDGLVEIEEDDAQTSKGEADQRIANRKGTGFVKKGQLPIDDDEDDGELPEPTGTAGNASKPQKRSKDRKGTGFIKKGQLPIDDDEEED